MDTTKLIHLIKNTKSIKHAKIIHQKAITSGLQTNIAICKNLITLYFSCHLYNSANLVFKSIEHPLDITLWNTLVSNYTKSYMFNEAIKVYENLVHFSTNLKPDSYTYPSVLKACSGLKDGNLGKKIHTHLVKNGFESDVVVMSSLFGMYAKCGMFRVAVKVFDEMPERDVGCWNTVISCYLHDGKYAKALEVFGEMRDCGFERDSVSYTTAISACAKVMDVERGKVVHEEAVRNGFGSDGFVQAALVDMYGKCGCLEMAVQVFEDIEFKSLVSWNSMIAGYSLRGDSKSCVHLLSRMNRDGIRPNSTSLSSSLMACSKSANLKHGKFIHGYIIKNNIKFDTFMYTSLVDVYFKCGKTSSAEYIFKKMPKTNVVEWNLMISGYVAAGSYLESLGIYNDMNAAGIKPDAITFTSILAACSQLGALERGKEIHKCIIEGKFESNEIVMGALLDMYTKCGAVDEAQQVFSRLPERDLISWTTMITAYGSHGRAFKALKLFQEMQDFNIKPDRVVFLAVISTCSHAGLVNEGCYYFNQMVNDYSIKPKIADYSCLVDLLGRAGRLHEAYAILQRTASIREDVELLSTLFSACHIHGDLELGEKIGSLLVNKTPDDPSTYIVLANMYASLKKWDEARKVRLKMKELGLRKNPGFTWIEIDKKIVPFLVEDKSIPQAGFVYQCLSVLAGHMNKDELLFQKTISNM